LKLEQARLDREEDWSEEELIEHFQRWAQNPKVRDWICGKCVSEEERVRRMREIFGLAPDGTANRTGQVGEPTPDPSKEGNGTPAPGDEKSDSIKPNQTR
jgi:hypothetical protein